MTCHDVVLPFLERTTFFLYPIGVVIVLSPICKYLIIVHSISVLHNVLILHLESKHNFLFPVILSGFNPSRYFMNIYFSRQIWSFQLKLLTSLCHVEVISNGDYKMREALMNVWLFVRRVQYPAMHHFRPSSINRSWTVVSQGSQCIFYRY